MSDQDQTTPETSEELKQDEQLQEQNPAEETMEAAEQAVEGDVEEAVSELDGLTAKLQEAEAAVEEAKADVLRAQADAQNIRRRAEADVEKAHKFSIEKFAKEMLPIVDNLERALAMAPQDDENAKSFVEGIEMTHKAFIDGLKKFNIEQVDPMGHPFDPELHQAMSMQENPDVEPNTVMAVFEKGYTNHGRLLRPAMVVVCKGSGKVDTKA